MRLGCKFRKILVEGIQGTLFGIRVWPGARVGLGIIVSVGVGTKVLRPGNPLVGGPGMAQFNRCVEAPVPVPAVVWRLVLLVVSEMSAHRGQVEACNSRTGKVQVLSKK